MAKPALENTRIAVRINGGIRTGSNPANTGVPVEEVTGLLISSDGIPTPSIFNYELLPELDSNHDGIVNTTDLPPADRNHDGRIDRIELMLDRQDYRRTMNVDIAALNQGFRDQLGALVRYFDRSGDGMMQGSEYSACMDYINRLPLRSTQPDRTKPITTESLLESMSKDLGHGLPENVIPVPRVQAR